MLESWCKKNSFLPPLLPFGTHDPEWRPQLENVIAERVNGILKDETFEKTFFNYGQAVKGIFVAISIYNHQRPHGNINYLTPIEAHF